MVRRHPPEAALLLKPLSKPREGAAGSRQVSGMSATSISSFLRAARQPTASLPPSGLLGRPSPIAAGLARTRQDSWEQAVASSSEPLAVSYLILDLSAHN